MKADAGKAQGCQRASGGHASWLRVVEIRSVRSCLQLPHVRGLVQVDGRWGSQNNPPPLDHNIKNKE